MEKLAIHGGTPVRTAPFPVYNSIGEEEALAAYETVKTGILSDFIGAEGPFFLGGEKVRELEERYKAHCGVDYAVAMNSATAVIIATMGAFGIGPGDEVLVTPYSHVISATAPLLYNAIPVFVDSEPDTFCMAPEAIEKAITPRTKAMIIVDLFGQSADMGAINRIAKKHDILVLSDSAHITIANYKGKRAGTFADIGSYSLNNHKTIHCGEGGVAVTNDADLAHRLRLIRNHAENCVGSMGYANLINMVGYNFRLTEMDAAIACEQIKKAESLVQPRRELCEHLTKRLTGLPGITPPILRKDCEHDYLLYILKYDEKVVGVSRDEFMRRLDAEGISLSVDDQRHVPPIGTFVTPIHLQPVFQQKTIYKKGCPWSCEHFSDGKVSYDKGITPVVEDLYERSLISVNAIYPPITLSDIDDIADAVIKVAKLSRST